MTIICKHIIMILSNAITSKSRSCNSYKYCYFLVPFGELLKFSSDLTILISVFVFRSYSLHVLYWFLHRWYKSTISIYFSLEYDFRFNGVLSILYQIWPAQLYFQVHVFNVLYQWTNTQSEWLSHLPIYMTYLLWY